MLKLGARVDGRLGSVTVSYCFQYFVPIHYHIIHVSFCTLPEYSLSIYMYIYTSFVYQNVEIAKDSSLQEKVSLLQYVCTA